jgi:hypothetical protein
MAYGVFESTNMRSTHAGGRIYDCVANVDIENGTVCYLDGLATGETDIYTAKKGVSAGKTLVIADQPAWSADDSKITNQREDAFIIKAGTPFRGRVIYVDDKFAVNKECFAAAAQDSLEAGLAVTVDGDTGKLVAKGAGSTVGFAGTIEYTRKRGETLVTSAHTYGDTSMRYIIKVSEVA